MKRESFFRRFNKRGRTPLDAEEHELKIEKEDMIKGVFTLAETTVKEVMVPRIDVAFLSVDMDPGEAITKIGESGHSRLPVYQETIDNVVGILYAKDLLIAYAEGKSIVLEEVVRNPFFVPDSKRLDSLLSEMRRRRVHIAVAVDEYGGVSGIVCMEDILEEIVGEIQDEFDNEREDILEIGKNVYLCDARVDIEDLNEEVGLNLPDDDFDTLGGFVFDLFGKIPVRYEKVTYEDAGFVIQEMEGHKIKTVKILAATNDKAQTG